jgi:Flp pilus assembly pilin Flp
MMKQVFARLWRDDDGALIAIEFLFVATILIIGIIVGLAGLRDAVVVELTELGNAILALNQGFQFSGLSGCCAQTEGSQAIDTSSLLVPPVCIPPSSPSVIDVIPCT